MLPTFQNQAMDQAGLLQGQFQGQLQPQRPYMEIESEAEAEAELQTDFGRLPPEQRHDQIMRALQTKLSAPAREWQAGFAQRYTDAIRSNESRKFLVVMPPGAGKTWTAWFAMLMETLGRTVNRNKVLYAVPLVALGEQKVAEIDDLFKSIQMQLAIPAGVRTVNAKEVVGMNPSRSLVNTRTAVCTFEHCLIYLLGLFEKQRISPTQEGMLIDTLKLVVIDEAHEIGAEGRGFVVDRICAICSALEIPFLMLTGTLSRTSAVTIAQRLGIPEYGLIYGADAFRPFQASTIVEKGPVFGQLLAALIQTALERAYEHPGVDRTRQQQGGLLVFVTTRADTEKYAALALAIAFDANLIPGIRTYGHGEQTGETSMVSHEGSAGYKPPEKFVNKQAQIVDFLSKNSQLVTQEARTFVKSLSMQRLAQLEWSTGIAYNCTEIGDEYEQLVKAHAQMPPTKTHIKVFVATNTLAVGVNLSAIDDVAIASLMRVRTRVSGDTIQQEIGRAARWRNATVLVNDDGKAEDQLRAFDIPHRNAMPLLPSFLLQLATRFPEIIRRVDRVEAILGGMYWDIPEPRQAIIESVEANQDILGLRNTGESVILVSHLELEPQEAQMMTPQTLRVYRTVLGAMNDEETWQQPWSLFWPAFLTGLIQEARFPTHERVTVKHFEMFGKADNLRRLLEASVYHGDFLARFPSMYDLNLALSAYIINDAGNPRNSTYPTSKPSPYFGRPDLLLQALYNGSYTNNSYEVHSIGRLLFRDFARFARARDLEWAQKDALFAATLGLVGETQTKEADAKRRYAKAMMVGMYGSLALMGYVNEWNTRFTVPVSELILLLQSTLKTMSMYLVSLSNMQYSGLTAEEATRIRQFQARARQQIQAVGLYEYLTQKKDSDFRWFLRHIREHNILGAIFKDNIAITLDDASSKVFSLCYP